MAEQKNGIWLEVTDVSLETGKDTKCRVLLKCDREHPKSVWWPVSNDAVVAATGANAALETYKAILRELDKKRLVLAHLGSDDSAERWLHCRAFRFQSPDLGSR